MLIDVNSQLGGFSPIIGHVSLTKMSLEVGRYGEGWTMSGLFMSKTGYT